MWAASSAASAQEESNAHRLLPRKICHLQTAPATAFPIAFSYNCFPLHKNQSKIVQKRLSWVPAIKKTFLYWAHNLINRIIPEMWSKKSTAPQGASFCLRSYLDYSHKQIRNNRGYPAESPMRLKGQKRSIKCLSYGPQNMTKPSVQTYGHLPAWWQQSMAFPHLFRSSHPIEISGDSALPLLSSYFGEDEEHFRHTHAAVHFKAICCDISQNSIWVICFLTDKAFIYKHIEQVSPTEN